MQFNFLNSLKLSSDTQNLSEGTASVIKVAKKIAPVLFLAAILPVIYGLFVNPSQIKLSSEASANQEIRIWFEPSNVILRNGKQATLTVYAQFESDSETITSLKVPFTYASNIYLDKNNLYSTKPFKGKVELGQINVSGNYLGTYELSVPENGVVITGLDHPVKIVTAPANLTVK